MWLQDLRALYRETSIKIHEDEDKEVLSDFQDIYSIANNRARMITERGTILLKLDNLEVKLRRILQKRKMLLPTKDDPRWAVLKR